MEGVQPPECWSTTEHVAWKAAIPGRGWSSPIVWGDRVFLTTVTSDTPLGEPRKGLFIQGLRGSLPAGTHHWWVKCLALDDGRLLWEREVHSGSPPETIHLKNSFASETPVVDRERVIAHFGNVGLFCFTHEGELMWSQPCEPQPMRSGWGTAASPVLHESVVFVVNDNDRASYVAAYQAATGQELWRVKREEHSNWATPLIWKHGERSELVTAGSDRVRSYDLTGKLLWEFEGMSQTCIPTPVAGKDLLYLCSGYIGDATRPLFAVKPGAMGDISLQEDDTHNEFIAWMHPSGGPYHPTPLCVGDYVYVLYDKGFLSCYDAKTGREKYSRQRLGVSSFTASPWYANGKIFCLNEEGDTIMVKAGPEFEILGKNSLGEMCLATPALVGERLLIRTVSHVWCLK